MRSNEAEGILTDLIEGHVPPEPGVAPTGLPPSVRSLIRALHADLRSVSLPIQLQYFTGKSGTGVRLLWGPPPEGEQFQSHRLSRPSPGSRAWSRGIPNHE